MELICSISRQWHRLGSWKFGSFFLAKISARIPFKWEVSLDNWAAKPTGKPPNGGYLFKECDRRPEEKKIQTAKASWISIDLYPP